MSKYLAVLLTAVFTIACQYSPEKSASGSVESLEESWADMSPESDIEVEPPRTAEPPPPPSAPFPYTDEFGEGQPAGRTDLPPARKIIRNANVAISVTSYEKSSAALRQLAQRLGADISNEAEERSSWLIANHFVIRIAPDKLDELLAELEKMALHVDSKSVDSRDVTREYLDIETRLSVKRSTLERYREILRSAKTVTDILAVEEQIRVLIEDIESAETQLRGLRDEVQRSTVYLNMYQEFARPDVARPSFWNRIGNGFTEGWHTFLDIVVGLVYVWPIALLLGLGVWWLLRKIRRRRAA